MAGKSKRREYLREKAQASRRAPSPERLVSKKDGGYKVRTVSLYPMDEQWLAYVVGLLGKAGLPKANHSFVLQECLRLNREGLEEKEPGEIVDFFKRRYLKRLPE